MPTPTKGPRLGGSPAHERLMLANLATSLFEHGRITTTETKAKRLRPYAEKLVTFAKRGDLHARRQVMTVIRDKDVVHTPVRRDRPALREPPRWLHPHHQGRSPQGRQRADGRHRAGRGADRGPAGRRRGRARPWHPVRRVVRRGAGAASAAGEVTADVTEPGLVDRRHHRPGWRHQPGRRRRCRGARGGGGDRHRRLQPRRRAPGRRRRHPGADRREPGRRRRPGPSPDVAAAAAAEVEAAELGDAATAGAHAPGGEPEVDPK